MEDTAMEGLFWPETDLEKRICLDPEWKKGAMWGKPRPGHSEGQVISHIAEVLANVDRLASSDEERRDLRLIALIHDTFKYRVDPTTPKVGENHHGKIARRFAERYLDDLALLEIIELHDEAIHEDLLPVPVAPDTFIYGLQWNPRHFWLAILADSTPGTTTPALYVSDLAGHRLLAPLALDGAHEMTWSPDGRTLAVVEQNGDVVLLTLQQATGTLAVTRTRTLAVDTASDESVVWSPSGRWLVCRHGTYTGEDYLFLPAADGSGKQVKLTSSTTDGQLVAVAWSPDGKQLIVARASDGVLMSLKIADVLKAKGVKL